MDRALRRLLETADMSRAALPEIESGKLLCGQHDKIKAWYASSAAILRMLKEDAGQPKLKPEKLAPNHIRLKSDGETAPVLLRTAVQIPRPAEQPSLRKNRSSPTM